MPTCCLFTTQVSCSGFSCGQPHGPGLCGPVGSAVFSLGRNMRDGVERCGQISSYKSHFNIIIFQQNTHKRHPISCPLGQALGCLLWVHVWSILLCLSLLFFMSNHVMFGWVIVELIVFILSLQSISYFRKTLSIPCLLMLWLLSCNVMLCLIML